MSSTAEKSVSYVLAKPVSQYMDPDVLILDGETPTADATRILQRYERDDIVVTVNNEPMGIVTDEDILRQVGDISVYAESTRLKEIMNSPLITVDQNASLREALLLMRDKKIRKLPVLSKKNKVIGIILQGTIANAIRNASSLQPRFLSTPIKAILGNLGFVLQFAGVLLMVPAVLATVLTEFETASSIYLTSVSLMVLGFFLNSYGEKSSLNLRQASILVFLSLFILTLFGTIPYLYLDPFNDKPGIETFANSFFSSAAGFTTGGISLFDKPEDLPQSFTFYRSFTQLVGGMSFIYLAMTAFYPSGKLRSMRGFISGKTLHLKELFGTITVVFAVYIVIVAVLLYLFGERNIIDNFSLSMSTLATGGFVPHSTILIDLLWQEYVVLIGGMILGALPFTFHYAFVRKKFLSPKLGTEVLIYFGVVGISIILFTWASGFDFVTGAFYTVSASSTAGLQLESLDFLTGPAKTILILLMFIGGCGFSTAGGIKIYRIMTLKSIRKAFHHKTKQTMTDSDRKEVISAIIILALFPILTTITAVSLSSEETDFSNAFFDATGVVTTGGLSTNTITVDVEPSTKILLGMLMILGRLEIIAIVYIFIPKLSP